MGGRGRVWRAAGGPAAVDQFDERDKQALLPYYRGHLHESFWGGNHDGVAVAASGQPKTRPLFMTSPQLVIPRPSEEGHFWSGRITFANLNYRT